MNIAICDNDREFNKYLGSLLIEYELCSHAEINFRCFTDYSELEGISQDFDLFLLDYDMNDNENSSEELKTDGMTFAKKIRSIYGMKKEIIFITAYPDFIYESFEVRAFRFITKPIEKSILFKALDDLINSPVSSFISIVTREQTIVINSEDVLYFDVLGIRTSIHTKNETLIFRRPMSYFEKQIKSSCFFRIHKSYIVNIQYVSDFNYSHVTLKNGETLPLSQKKYAEFSECFVRYYKR